MTRLAEAFAAAEADRRGTLVGYLPAGLTPAATFTAMVEAGVDAVEVGLPYSDPVIDGPVIQQAVDRALAAGTTPADVLRTVEAVGEFPRAGQRAHQGGPDDDAVGVPGHLGGLVGVGHTQPDTHRQVGHPPDPGDQARRRGRRLRPGAGHAHDRRGVHEAAAQRRDPGDPLVR